MMVRIIRKRVMTLIMTLCLLVGNFYCPVRTEASVVLGVTIYEAMEALALSIGSTYLVYEGAEQSGLIDDLKDFFKEYVFGTGAEKWEEVEESQMKLYEKGSGGNNEDPENDNNSSDEDKLNNIMNLAVSVETTQFIEDFWKNVFSSSTDTPFSPDYVPESFIRYSDAPGLIGKVRFGAGPVFSELENRLNNLGHNYRAGSVVWREVKSENNSASYDGVARYVEAGREDIKPVLYIDTTTVCTDFVWNLAAYWTGGFCGLEKGNNANADGSYNNYPVFRSALYLGDAVGNRIAIAQSNWKAGVTSLTSFMPHWYGCMDTGGQVYFNIPDTLIIDKITGLTYYYDSSGGLYRRQYDDFGGYAQSNVEGGYVYNINGTYQSLSDIYKNASAADFILERISNLENFIRTNFPDEVPYINYSDIEGLQPSINEAQQNQIGSYPVGQPNTPEVPSTYPQEMDGIMQGVLTNPGTNPGVNPGTNPEPNPEPEPEPNPEEKTDEDAEKDENKKSTASSNKSDYALSLGSFFPFCIPKDLYLVIKGFSASPKTPKFTIPFPYKDKNGMKKKEITIDLTDFNGMAKTIRTAEVILFIATLLFISRKLVKGG